MTGLTRRTLVAAGLAAPAILRAQPMRFAAWPFRLGLAAGDPAPDGFVLWTRLAPAPLEPGGGMPMAAMAVTWQVARDRAFREIAATGEAIARPELAHSVHVEVSGLDPDRPYFYRFLCGGERSDTGTARTLPVAGSAVARVRFAVAGCQHYEPGHFTAWARLAADPDLAFCYHYGDYIYEGRDYQSPTDRPRAPFVRHHGSAEIYSIDDYRRRCALYKLDPDLQAAHRALAMFHTLDDHEVEDNWTGEQGHRDAPPEVFLLRRAAAYQAWYEHMPVRARALPRGGAIDIVREALIGDLVDLRLLDTRQFRSGPSCGRLFTPRCPDAAAQAQMLGPAQERATLAALARPRARWTALAQQVMMMDLDRRTTPEGPPILSMDSWSGYTTPRRRLIDGMGGRGDVIVLTGDEHQHFAGTLRDSRGRAQGVEFVATSISSGGDGSDLRAGADQVAADNPDLAFQCDLRGYATCTVERDRWTTDMMVLDRVSTPGGALSRRARFVVERGRSEPVLEG